MKNYLVLQHSYSEFLGLIESQLQQRDIGFSYSRPFLGDALPPGVGQYDGVFVMNGPWPTADEERNDFVDGEIALIKNFQKAQRPVIGIGMGGLIVAQAAGGTARMTPLHNARFVTAHKTAAGEGDELAEALDGQEVLMFHSGSVDLPEGLEPILVDEEGAWLAIRPDALTYGLLFRPEMKPGLLEDIIMEEGHNPPDNISELLAQARLKWTQMQKITDLSIVALVKGADLMQERRKMPVFNLKVASDESTKH